MSTRPLYLCIPGLNGQEEVREFDVPVGAVPFEIGAPCPVCIGPEVEPGTPIKMIDWGRREFECLHTRHTELPEQIVYQTHDGHLRTRWT